MENSEEDIDEFFEDVDELRDDAAERGRVLDAVMAVKNQIMQPRLDDDADAGADAALPSNPNSRILSKLHRRDAPTATAQLPLRAQRQPPVRPAQLQLPQPQPIQ